jgi:hypothetical protein
LAGSGWNWFSKKGTPVHPQPLILIGDSLFAEIAYEYFTHDSDYQVVAFAVEKEYLKRDQLCGLPVVPFEGIEQVYAPGEHSFYATVGYSRLNRLRTRLYLAARGKGYRPASATTSATIQRSAITASSPPMSSFPEACKLAKVAFSGSTVRWPTI